jgi:hypothetical protein
MQTRSVGANMTFTNIFWPLALLFVFNMTGVVFMCFSPLFWCGDFRAIRHPASGYVQGINDLVTPFLVVFLSEHLEGNMDSWSMDNLSAQDISNIEADCYWCLSKFLDGMQDHYTFAQPGIQRLVFRLKELVRRIDGNVPLILIYIATSCSTF